MDFQELENEIFRTVCEIGCAVTAEILTKTDDRLARERNTKRFRDKGRRGTTVKTRYGDVSVRRHFYIDREKKKGVYLLDEEIGLSNNTGLFSANVAELIVQACSRMSFASAAEFVSEYTGRDISKVGCWNIFQEVAAQIKEEDLIEPSEDGEPEVLFEEADGVWVDTQDRNKKSGSMEIKMATIYEGWEADDPKRLRNKTLIGGYVNSEDLRDKVEAVKDVLYGPERNSMVIVNGDGAGWIDNIEEGTAIRQLDFFHIQKYINRYIKEKDIQKKIRRALRDKKPDRVLELIDMYINSLDGQDQKAVENARKLRSYLDRGDEILSWMDRIQQPKAPEGIVYKRGGIQESQNTMISARMKHGKKRWSVKGGCNMAKMLCIMKNGLLEKLIRTMDCSSPSLKEAVKSDTVLFSARDNKKHIGKGSKYVEVFATSVPSLANARSSISEAMRGIINSYGFSMA